MGENPERIIHPIENFGPRDVSNLYWESDKIALAVGYCQSAWGEVEGELSNIYRVVANIPKCEIAIASFYSVVSFDGKLQMVDSVMKRGLIEFASTLRKWESLHKDIKKLKSKRNKLSHGRIVTYSVGSDGGCHWIPYYNGNTLMDSIEFGGAIPKILPGNPMGAMCSDDILIVERDFRFLAERLNILLGDLIEELGFPISV